MVPWLPHSSLQETSMIRIGRSGATLRLVDGFVLVDMKQHPPAKTLRQALEQYYRTDLLWDLNGLAKACVKFGFTPADLYSEDPEGFKGWLQHGKEYPWPWSKADDDRPGGKETREKLVRDLRPGREKDVAQLLALLPEDAPEGLRNFLTELAE